MIKVICDKTGTEEVIPGSSIEFREGKKPNTWVWVIKGIENLKNFAPNAYDPEIDLLLSRSAQEAWDQKNVQLTKQAKDARVKALKELKKA